MMITKGFGDEQMIISKGYSVLIRIEVLRLKSLLIKVIRLFSKI